MRRFREVVGDRQVMSDWLHQLQWDYFATFTFRYRSSPESAKRVLRRFLENIEPSAKCFFAVERHNFQDYVHLHALLANLKKFGCFQLMKIWDKKYGHARVYRYDGNKKVCDYITKRIGDKFSDWDII